MESVIKLFSLVLLFTPSTLWVVSGSVDNIVIDQQCSITDGCLQCISSQSPEVERCQQLYFLINETHNHPAEEKKYCSGNCPIVLATAHYYCNSQPPAIKRLFEECSSYSVVPTGNEDIILNEVRTCVPNSNHQVCDECINRRSKGVLKCLQHYLLMKNTNNTSYRQSFCQGDCPLTLRTSEWYCGGFNPFDECMTNQNKRYCEDLKEEAMDDPVYLRCQDSPDCNYFECREAIEKYECCLASIGPDAGSCNANITACSVETGGSPAHYATPLFTSTLMILALFRVY